MNKTIVWIALLLAGPSLWANPQRGSLDYIQKQLTVWKDQWTQSRPMENNVLQAMQTEQLDSLSQFMQGSLGARFRTAVVLTAENDTGFSQSIDSFVENLDYFYELVSPEDLFRLTMTESVGPETRGFLWMPSGSRYTIPEMAAAGWTSANTTKAFTKALTLLQKKPRFQVLKVPLSYMLEPGKWTAIHDLIVNVAPAYLGELNDDRIRIVLTGTRAEWEAVSNIPRLAERFKELADDVELLIFDMSRLNLTLECEESLEHGH